MNRLYSILMNGKQQLPVWHLKKTEPVQLTAEARELASTLVPDGANAAVTADCICRLAVLSVFGKDILALDPVNTYGELSRQTASPVSSMPSSQAMDACARLLSADIRKRLASPSPIDMVGAICLQLLEYCYG